MKIWIVNHYAIPSSRAGGTRHHDLARHLVRRGHDVTIIASSFDHVTRREMVLVSGEEYRVEEIEGVRFLWIRTPPYSGNSLARVRNMVAFSYRILQKFFCKLLGKPDVIVGSSPHPFAALAAERLATRYRVPFVLEVRDLWPETLIQLGHFYRYHPFVLLLESVERYLYHRASRIITLLPQAAEYIEKKGGTASKIVWIPNGIDLERLPSPKPPKARDYFVVMYAGSHGLANCLGVLIEAARILQWEAWSERVRFRLIGDGPEKPALIQRARQLGLRNVIFEDPVPKTRVYDLLSDADVLVIILKDSPLYKWGVSPNKLFDYMAAARPVIFCGNTDFNPIAEVQAGITVKAINGEGLAQAIRTLIDMPVEERWRMGLRGREYVETHHGLHMLAGTLEETLNQVASDAAPSSSSAFFCRRA